MPHSSGGGSHSGGSHSGSGFSSSSSSSGGSSAKHIKHTSFPGARRYVYYENYRPVYVYAYVVDTCTECPHCGAPIPPEDQPGARFA